MPILTRPSFGPRTALIYITIGSLVDVWTLVWYFTRTYDLSRDGWFWLTGLFLTGFTFLLIGFFLGPIGRAARAAELPPHSALPVEANIERTAAANPPAVATGMGVAGAGAAVPAQPVAAATPAMAAPPAGTGMVTQATSTPLR